MEYKIDAMVFVIKGRQDIYLLQDDNSESRWMKSCIIREALEAKDIIDNMYIDLGYDIFKPCVRDIEDFAVRVKGRCISGISNEQPDMNCKIDEIQDLSIEDALQVCIAYNINRRIMNNEQ